MLWIWRNLPAGLSFSIQPEILAVFFCKNEELAYWKRQRKPCFHKERKKNNEKNQKKKRIRRKNAGKDIWAD